MFGETSMECIERSCEAAVELVGVTTLQAERLRGLVRDILHAARDMQTELVDMRGIASEAQSELREQVDSLIEDELWH
jgi:hypothetical protein